MDNKSTTNDGEWVQVTHRRKTTTAHHSHQPRPRNNQAIDRTVTWRDKAGVTTFYFCRFPTWVKEKDLWQVFHRWGKVWEVFIPKNRNKEGHRYGFVRFKEVEDEMRLERQLDNNIFFGEMKMFVNRPKFERRKAVRLNIKDDCQPDNGKPQRVINYEERLQRTSTTDARLRSYAEVVKTSPMGDGALHNQGADSSQPSMAEHRPPAVITTNMEQNQWIQQAWVGRLKNRGMFERLEDELKWVLDPEVTPCYWGDDWIILHNMEDTKATRLVKEEKTYGSTPILDLQKWSQDIRPSHRLAWILLWGLPPSAWDSECMGKVVEGVGEMVEVDDYVERRRRLDVARILIRTAMKPGIRTELQAVIDGTEIALHVIEDMSCLGTTRDQQRMGSWLPPSPLSTEPNSPVSDGTDIFGIDSILEFPEDGPEDDGVGVSTAERRVRDTQTCCDQWTQTTGRCGLDRSFTANDDVDASHDDNAVLKNYPTVEGLARSHETGVGQNGLQQGTLNASGNRREKFPLRAPLRHLEQHAGQQRNPNEETSADMDHYSEKKQEQKHRNVACPPTPPAMTDNRDNISPHQHETNMAKGDMGLRPPGPIPGSAETKFYVRRRKIIKGLRETAHINQVLPEEHLTPLTMVPTTKGTSQTGHITTASLLELNSTKQDLCFGEPNPYILESQCALIEEMGLTHGDNSRKLREMMSDMEKRDSNLAVEMGIKQAQP